MRTALLKKPPRRSAILVCTVVVFLLLFVWFRHQVVKTDGLATVLASLEREDFHPNIGFSGLFVPGTLVQTAQQGTNGEDQRLSAPIPFAWASQCFPNQKPQSSQYALPNSKGSAEAKLSADSASLPKLWPSLATENTATADYTLLFENTRLEAFAKGDISGEFSSDCVKKLNRALAGGDKIAWYGVITEVIVADSMKFQIHWKDSSSAQSRLALIDAVKKGGPRPSAPIPKEPENHDLSLQLANNNERETELASTGVVILAYKYRPLQAWNGDNGNKK